MNGVEDLVHLLGPIWLVSLALAVYYGVRASLEPAAGPLGGLSRNALAYELLSAAGAAVLAGGLHLAFHRRRPGLAASVAIVILISLEWGAWWADQRVQYELSPVPRAASFLLGAVAALPIAVVAVRAARRMARPLGAQKLISASSLLALVVAGSLQTREHPVDGPDIALVVLDALQIRALGAYGSPLENSPNIDALAKEGWISDGAFAVAATSVPGHASTLSGLGVTGHRAPTNEFDLPADLPPFVAERLRDRGHLTLGFCHNPLVSPRGGFARGFDSYWVWGKRRFSDAPLPLVFFQWSPVYLALKALDIDTVTLAARWALVTARGPAFVFLQLLYTHDTYVDGDQWATPERIETVLALYRNGEWENRTSYSDEEVAAFHARYLGAVKYSDRLLGAVLTRMRQRAADRGLLTIVTADHGENLAEHGDDALGKQLGAWSTSLRIPLIVHDSREPTSGIRLRALTSQEDIAPLILERSHPDPRTSVEAVLARKIHFAFSRPWMVLVDDSLKVAMQVDDLQNSVRVHRWREDFEDRAALDLESAPRAAEMRAQLVALYDSLQTTGFFEPPRATSDQKLEQLRAHGYIE